MEGGESPLDVLSRAATMVQENQAYSATGSLAVPRILRFFFNKSKKYRDSRRVEYHHRDEVNSCDDSSKQSCQKQTTKWKRDRRSRLPEYSRKSDPKFSETFGLETSSAETSPNGINSNGLSQKQPNESANGVPVDTPLDMSVRQRGLPPSYSQTINNPGYRSNYRPSVIQNGVPSREELPSGISMCDPIIDEHFRRSLGNDYHTLFQNNNFTKEQCAPKSPPKSPTNVVELMDNTGLSVDDHFAKALGDTWVKLNKKESEVKTNTSENNLVST